MNVTDQQIFLNPLWLGGSLLLFAWTILRGKPEIALGIFFAINGWIRNVWFGPLVHNYALVLVIGAAMVVMMYRREKAGEPLFSFPRHDRWILVILVMWIAWMLFLIEIFNPPGMRNLRRNLILEIGAGLPALFLIGRDLYRVRHFAIAYVATSLLGGYTFLVGLEVPFSALWSDPSLSSYGVNRLTVSNYHTVAWIFASSLILVTALFLQTRNLLLLALFAIGAVMASQFLMLAGSRQSMAGGLIGAAVVSLWALFHRRTPKIQVLALIFAVSLLIGLIYQEAPHLVVRQNEADVSQAFNVVDDRSQYWQQGWQVFLASPMWGSGFVFYYTHNLTIGTLAEQGLVGMTFLLLYLWFVTRQSARIVDGRGDEEHALWRVTFFAVIVFTLIHGQASGSPISARHLYWAGLLLWYQSEIVRAAPFALHLPVLPRRTLPSPQRTALPQASQQYKLYL